MHRQTIAAFAVLAVCTTAVRAAHAQFFEPPVTQTYFGGYTQTVVGDVNGDGRADALVLVANEFGSAWSVFVTEGEGSPGSSYSLSAASGRPTIADADGDGYRDILLPQSTGVRIYWGNSDRVFIEFSDILTARPLSNIAVGDLTGDNVPDLTFTRAGSPAQLSLMPGRPGREFGAAILLPATGNITQVAIGNANGDSSPDLYLLVTTLGTSADPSAVVLLGAPGTAFTALDPVTLPRATLAMTVADVTGDGLDEAIIAARGVQVDMVWVTSGGLIRYFLGGVPPAAAPPDVSDVDGDGLIDVTVAMFDSPNAVVLHGRSDGQFIPATPFPIAPATPTATAFGDLNGDGAMDVLALVRRSSLNETDYAVTRHVTPLRISTFAPSATAGPGGTAAVTVEAMVDSGHSGVTLSWFDGATPIGSGTRLFLSLPVGVHTLIVRGATPAGLKATATAVVTVVPLVPPASETTVSAIQNTLDARLDVAVSTRASAADVAAVAQAVNALRASLGADQTRLTIEQALARGDKIASFYLPAGQGGQLDLVRTIVIDVADKNEAAAGNTMAVAKARKVIAEADVKKAAGDYRGAYLLYSVAYQILGA